MKNQPNMAKIRKNELTNYENQPKTDNVYLFYQIVEMS